MTAAFSHYEQCPECANNGKDTSKDNLAVWKDGSKFCFACKHRVKSPMYLSQVDKGYDKDTIIRRLIPEDFSYQIPSSAFSWLAKFGMPYSYWKRKIGWSEYHQRLVFRVGDPIQFSIGRYFGPDKAVRKWYVWGNSHKHVEVISNDPSVDAVVLVEDLISAHKVGQVATAIPLFGTRISPAVLYYLRSVDKPVFLWLDKDQEQYVTKEAVRLQELINRPVYTVTTNDDPKLLSYTQIGLNLIKEDIYGNENESVSQHEEPAGTNYE